MRLVASHSTVACFETDLKDGEGNHSISIGLTESSNIQTSKLEFKKQVFKVQVTLKFMYITT